jgi:dipeptide/tripeptide permease
VHDASALQYPTEVELKTLKRVADDLPWSAFLIAIVELCERFAYYGLIGPFQNYIGNKWKDPNGLPGAIGETPVIFSHGFHARVDVVVD